MRSVAVVLLLAWPVVAAAQAGTPGRARDAYERAVGLEARGNHAAALTLLWEAGGLAPSDADIQNRLGEALDRIGALDAAADAFRRAVAARPGFRKAENNLILTLAKGGRGREAVARAEALVAATPSDPDAHFTLGLALAEQDIDRALEVFSRVVSMAPRHTLARYNLALVLKRADRLAEAIDELRRALDVEPHAEAHHTLAVIYWHQGEADRAVASLRAAIEHDGRHVASHHLLGTVLRARRDWRGAAAALRRAIELQPDLWGAHYTLAQVLQASGDAAGAARHFDAAERLRVGRQQEQEAGVWTSVGIGRLDAGDAAGAAECFRRATAALETYAPAHYQLGRALAALGRHEEARAAFTRAHRLNPSLVPPQGPR